MAHVQIRDCLWQIPIVFIAAVASGAESSVRVAAVSQSWAAAERTLPHVLSLLDQAARQNAQIVCLPQDCVPSQGGDDAQAALEAIGRAAAARKLYVVANLKERAGPKLYSTSYLVGRDGQIVAKYRKSHRLPDEPIALGDELPVFDTPWGKVGLMVGSDLAWPEVPLVLALKGAELILLSFTPEPVPQSFPFDLLTRVRALDDHVTFVCANYAGDLPYLCSNWPNYTGEPLGRALIVDRSGIVLADTSIRPGVAVASVDLQRTKDIYHLTFKEDRKLFQPLVDPQVKVTTVQAAKRRIKVSIAQVGFEHGPNPRPDSEFAKILDEAGRRGSDVILMTEFGMPTDTDDGRKTLELIAGKARQYQSYVVIGGMSDPERPYRRGGRASWGYLWDRTGKLAGKYRISQYGDSVELPVFTTDFGVIGIMLCGDVYSQEISRVLALQGAELILCPSQSWGPSGQFNLWMQQVRAIDNGVYMAAAHLPMSDISQRSYVLDPYGHILAATEYWRDSVCTAQVDLDAGRIWFARTDQPGTAGKPGYLAAYYPPTVPEKRADLRAVLWAGRRPELYGPIVEKTLASRAIPEATWEKMNEPRPAR
jgi:predicted amidohydrolase